MKPSTSLAPRNVKRPQLRESAEQKKARVLDRARELTQVARRGETPEEVKDKGRALQEIKKLRPWKYDGTKGGFSNWAKLYLPYRAARANHYIRIAKSLRLEQVAGRKLCCEALLEIAKAPAEMHQQLIAEAEAGASVRQLRRLRRGEVERGPDDPVATAERIVRLQRQINAELRKLEGQGDQVPEGLRRQIGEGAEVGGQLIEGLWGTAGDLPLPEPAPQGPGPKMDPRGSDPPPVPAAAGGRDAGTFL